MAAPRPYSSSTSNDSTHSVTAHGVCGERQTSLQTFCRRNTP